MLKWKQLRQFFTDYIHASEPVVIANNKLALLIALNQPFYPFYVRYIAGNEGGVSFFTLLTTPLFLSVPLIARRSQTFALASVPLIGLLNAAIATKALGSDVGLELFIIPCVVVTMLVADRANLLAVLASTTFALLIYFAVLFFGGEPMKHFDPQEAVRLYRLNAISVSCLVIFILFTFLRARHNRKGSP